MKDLYSEKNDTVLGAIDDLYKTEQKYKLSWANQARRNVAFANGDQNPNPIGAPIMINNQPVNTLSGESRASTYLTNEIEPIIRTLSSYMTRSKPDIKALASKDTPDHENVAKVAEKVNDAKYDLDNEAENSSNAAFWALTTGTVFGKDYWDYSLGSDVSVPQYDDNEQVIIDPNTGEPVVKVESSGNNATAILTPFTVGLDHSVTNFDEQPYIHEDYIMDVDWARQAFDQDKPGYTGLARSIQEDGAVTDTIALFEQMKYSIPYISTGAGILPTTKGKCLINEWYVRPNKQFPKGRMIIKAGGKIVYISDADMGSPYFLKMDNPVWHPYTCFKYEPYVGRFLGKSLVEQLIPLQMRLNEINGSILENANTMAKPNIMAAIGQLKRGIMNGKGANIYTYQHVPGAVPPFVLQGTPLPPQFFQERQNIIDQMVRIAGTNFVMQGQAPSGVTAAAAISQLLENANTQHSNMMLMWEKFHEKRFTKKLRIIHKFNIYPDKTLNQKLKDITNNCLDTQVNDFVGATDLADGINLKIEPMSMVPKSDVAKNQSYLDLSKEGLLSPQLREPTPAGDKMRAQLLEKLGLETLDSEESTELKKAKWENSRMLQGQIAEVSEYDNSAIHLPCHIGQIQDPQFLEKATPEIYDLFAQHIQAHRDQDLQKQQEQMNQQAMMQLQAQKNALANTMPPAPQPGVIPSPGAVPDEQDVPIQ